MNPQELFDYLEKDVDRRDCNFCRYSHYVDGDGHFCMIFDARLDQTNSFQLKRVTDCVKTFGKKDKK